VESNPLMLHRWKVVVLFAALGSCAAATAREPVTLSGHGGGVYGVCFSPDGSALATGSEDNTVRLWQLPVAIGRGEQQRRRQLILDLDHDSFGVRERASSELAKLGREVEPVLREALQATPSVEVRARLRRLLTALRAPVEEHHRAEVRCLAFSPDGRLLASGSKDKSIKLWNAHTGRAVATIDGRSGTIWSVAFSPDGSTLASGGMDHSVRLWNVSTGRLRATLQGHAGPVHSVAFSPDGETLVSAGSFDRTVKFWNLANGEPKAALEADRSAVLCVAFSPDGNTLAFAGYEGTIKLCNLATDRLPPISSLSGHAGTIRSLAFSPDGRTLASASEDNSVKLWQLGTGKPLADLKGHSRPVHSVAFSPDGRTLATASLDGTVKLWNLAARREPGTAGQAP